VSGSRPPTSSGSNQRPPSAANQRPPSTSNQRPPTANQRPPSTSNQRPPSTSNQRPPSTASASDRPGTEMGLVHSMYLGRDVGRLCPPINTGPSQFSDLPTSLTVLEVNENIWGCIIQLSEQTNKTFETICRANDLGNGSCKYHFRFPK
jgi:hypothetical protein